MHTENKISQSNQSLPAGGFNLNLRLYTLRSVTLYLMSTTIIIFSLMNYSDLKGNSSSKSTLVNNQLPEENNWLIVDNEPSELLISGVKVEDMRLLVDVRYNGGCRHHNFEIIWPDIIQIKSPSIYSVIILHDDNSDRCEQLINETLAFNLSEKPEIISRLGFDEFKIEVINANNTSKVLSQL